jgi:hypothetical protein
MTTLTTPDIAAATKFLAASARVLEWRLFERLFLGGDGAPVRDAVAAYRNSDGGFGHALEPDGRDPASQPAAIELGLRILNEADCWDDALVTGACDWLAANAPTALAREEPPAAGGAVFVAPSIKGWPRAPWWEPQPDGKPSLISTGQIAGTLHARGVAHPWLARATDLMWSMIDDLADPGPYDMRGVLRFLQYVPDRRRAIAAFERTGPLLLERGLATLDPDAHGDVHTPLDFAPEPGSLARSLFDEKTISAHLDHLAAGQRDDGGWTFNWLAWSPAAELDWRGHMTVDALRVLRANGRL